MEGKRTKHSNVYRLEGGRLFVRVTATIDGKKAFKRQLLPHGASEADALRLAAELKDQLAGKNKEEMRRAIPTLSAYVESWLAVKMKRLRDGVTAEWAHRLGVHCLPVKVAGDRDLGSLPLDQITRMTLDHWVAHAERARQAGKSRKPYAADTVTGWWRVLCQVLRDATADYDLPDPTRRVQAPKIVGVPKVREVKTLTLARLEKFLAAVEVHQPARHTEICFMGYTGCRPGEAYGLHWDDVHLDAVTPYADLKYSATRGKLQWVKTNESRPMPLVPRLVEILRAHKAMQLKGDAPQWSDDKGPLVFPSEKKSYRVEQSLAKAYRLCSHAEGVDQKVTPQVLRRSVNSILLDHGLDPLKIREILGHTTGAMTTRYANIPIERKAEALNRILEPQPAPPTTPTQPELP